MRHWSWYGSQRAICDIYWYQKTYRIFLFKKSCSFSNISIVVGLTESSDSIVHCWKRWLVFVVTCIKDAVSRPSCGGFQCFCVVGVVQAVYQYSVIRQSSSVSELVLEKLRSDQGSYHLSMNPWYASIAWRLWFTWKLFFFFEKRYSGARVGTPPHRNSNTEGSGIYSWTRTTQS